MSISQMGKLGHKDTELVVAKLVLALAPDSQADPFPLPLTLHKALKHA